MSPLLYDNPRLYVFLATPRLGIRCADGPESTAYLTDDNKGYLQPGFTATCSGCGPAAGITKAHLAVLKFARDAVADPTGEFVPQKYGLACYQACVLVVFAMICWVLKRFLAVGLCALNMICVIGVVRLTSRIDFVEPWRGLGTSGTNMCVPTGRRF